MSSTNSALSNSPVNPTTAHFTTQTIDKWLVVEFRTASLMDPVQLDQIAQQLYRLIDAEDRRRIIMDFEKVQYLSSQAIGIVMNMNKRLMALKGKLILCAVGGKLMELIKITRLDKVLIIKPTQAEAVKVVA
jgi:anti-sigma B factor antagonist